MNPAARFVPLARLLHWLMAALLLSQLLVHALFAFSPPIPVAHGETTP